MKIVFDTNALLIPFEFGLNPYEGVRDLVPGAEIVTLEECENELKKIKPRTYESVMSLGIQNRLKIVPSGITGLDTDDIIVEYADKNKCLVLTQDVLLKKKLLKKGLKVILMRRKKTFEILG